MRGSYRIQRTTGVQMRPWGMRACFRKFYPKSTRLCKFQPFGCSILSCLLFRPGSHSWRQSCRCSRSILSLGWFPHPPKQHRKGCRVLSKSTNLPVQLGFCPCTGTCTHRFSVQRLEHYSDQAPHLSQQIRRSGKPLALQTYNLPPLGIENTRPAAVQRSRLPPRSWQGRQCRQA